jgi:hypothetical protein
MPWHIESDHPECSGYGVVKDGTRELEGCHRTRAQAEAQMAALYASEPDVEEEDDEEEEISEDRAADPFPRRRQIEEMLAELRSARYSFSSDTPKLTD